MMKSLAGEGLGEGNGQVYAKTACKKLTKTKHRHTERHLWYHLGAKGFKFKRHLPIGPLIDVDFVCLIFSIYTGAQVSCASSPISGRGKRGLTVFLITSKANILFASLLNNKVLFDSE
jgi:hypothetical protein